MVLVLEVAGAPLDPFFFFFSYWPPIHFPAPASVLGTAHSCFSSAKLFWLKAAALCREAERLHPFPASHSAVATGRWHGGEKAQSPFLLVQLCVIYAPDTCGSGCSLPGSFSFALNLVSPKATPARNEMHPNLGLKLRFQETPPTSVSLLFIACFRDLQWEALVYIHPFRPVFLFRRREGQRKGENENLLQTPH